MAINFQYESISKLSFRKTPVKQWIKFIIELNHKKLGDLAYMFCDDPFILKINREYLQHDYYTDIITFDYDEEDIVSGDIFISVDTVRENSKEYGVTFENELLRVIIHGVLHLIGFDDTDDEKQAVMTQKENESLALFYSNFAV